MVVSLFSEEPKETDHRVMRSGIDFLVTLNSVHMESRNHHVDVGLDKSIINTISCPFAVLISNMYGPKLYD
jgi:hypothetical protein